MPFHFTREQELFLRAEGSGRFFAKKGSMVADQGKFKYSKRLLGTNKGNIVGQVLNHVARKLTGENLEIMEVEGSGVVYLADKSAHVSIITLEPKEPWNSVSVEAEDLLAFTEDCHYGVTPVGVGVLSQKGFFTSKLTYNGPNAQVAIKTNGNPLMIQAPCRVDPDAVVAWTGPAPKVTLDVNWKTLIGQTSGESYMFEFTEPGQFVILQPYEREAGIELAIDNDEDENYASSQSGIGGILGNILR
jgi:uncharacterized protein (AIM24 family)